MSLVMRDVGSAVAIYPSTGITAFCSTSTAIEGVQQNGATIDRLALGRRYLSCKAFVVANGERGTATSYAHAIQGVVGLQDSPTSTTWTDYSTANWGAGSGNIYNTTGTPAASTSTSTAWKATFDARFDLGRARRYIRPVFTGTVYAGSSAAGPNALLSGYMGLALGGAETLPTT